MTDPRTAFYINSVGVAGKVDFTEHLGGSCLPPKRPLVANRDLAVSDGWPSSAQPGPSILPNIDNTSSSHFITKTERLILRQLVDLTLIQCGSIVTQ